MTSWTPHSASPLSMAVLRDPLGEGWPSMDLVGEGLVSALPGAGVEVEALCPPLLPMIRRLPVMGQRRAALNADRVLTRHVLYPLRALRLPRRFDAYHVVDHSYAQLVHALPLDATGVYCHDLDAFRCLLEPEREPRPAWFRLLARSVLSGLQRACVVFYSTEAVRVQLERHRLIHPSRLVHAPYGVSPEFSLQPAPGDRSAEVLAPLEGRPFLFHVGGALPRKRLDVLFEVFAALSRKWPELRLVQLGAQLEGPLAAQVEQLGMGPRLLRPPKLDRATLAGLYRRASAVLVPSEAEGFGLPVIEALACGSVVVASDIPVLREVGGDAVIYCPVADISAWVERLDALLSGKAPGPTPEVRHARAARFTWASHAQTIAEAYRRFVPRRAH